LLLLLLLLLRMMVSMMMMSLLEMEVNEEVAVPLRRMTTGTKTLRAMVSH
jgi:hypothetical protein